VHYGLYAFRRSFAHFMLGKGVSAGASLTVLVLLIRELSAPEFGVYTSWQALILITGSLSSFGINGVLLRYIPELRANNDNTAMYRLLALGLIFRALLFGVAAIMLLAFSGKIAGLLKFNEFLWLFPVYLIAGTFLVNSTFTVNVLESLLWQREAQYSVAVATLLRLGGVLYLINSGTLSLPRYVWLEVMTEGLTWLLLLLAAFWRWWHDPERSEGSSDTLRNNAKRYRNFAIWSHAQNLTAALNGSAPNRLLIGYFLPIQSIALFGVVDRLINFLRRYEPLRLFVGLVRPVFNSRYRGREDFPNLLAIGDLLFRLNLLVLILPLIMFGVGGESLFHWLSKGQYTEAAPLFLGFYFVILISSVNTVLDLVVKMLEHTRIYTLSNIALSASLIFAIPLIPRFGLWSLVIANSVGVLVSVAIIVFYLRVYGFAIRVQGKWTGRIVVATVASISAGRLLLQLDVGSVIAVATSYAVFIVAMTVWPPFSPDERKDIRTFWDSKRKRTADAPHVSHDVEVRRSRFIW
jgi:O-antigen/teichoic acid export membrane protein